MEVRESKEGRKWESQGLLEDVLLELGLPEDGQEYDRHLRTFYTDRKA